MNFFSSDLHIFHENVIKYCDRPFKSIEEMDEVLIERHNSRLTNEDTWYFLGDFAMNMNAWGLNLHKFNFKRMVMVIGNHDKKIEKVLAKLNDRRPIEIHTKLKIDIGGYKVLLCHYPWRKPKDDEYDRMPERRPQRKDYPKTILLCGHTHVPKEQRIGDYMINVGVDAWDYYPVSEEEILDIIKSTARST